MKGKFNELINSEIPVLVDFYADWCGPCKMLKPILHELAKELDGKLKIISIDSDKNQEISYRYQIQSIPTLILFKQGNQLWRQAGVLPKPELKRILNQFI